MATPVSSSSQPTALRRWARAAAAPTSGTDSDTIASPASPTPAGPSRYAATSTTATAASSAAAVTAVRVSTAVIVVIVPALAAVRYYTVACAVADGTPCAAPLACHWISAQAQAPNATASSANPAAATTRIPAASPSISANGHRHSAIPAQAGTARDLTSAMPSRTNPIT